MEAYFEQAWRIWESGGILMWPLALVALIIYGTFTELFLHLVRHSVIRFSRHPEEGENSALRLWFQDVRNYSSNPREVAVRFSEARAVCLHRTDRRILFLQRILPAGPLLGLLGTVSGMLVTFASLGRGQQGGLLDLVAGGISEALITTQTGLLIAAPGYLLLSILRRRRDQLDESLNQLEGRAMEATWKRIHGNPTPSAP